MNKNRFSDKRLAKISSIKELRSTRNKVAVRLEILEDKFENGSWSLFNTESMLYNLTRKAAGIKGAWESAKEIFRNLRGAKVAAIAVQPEIQEEPSTPKPSRKPRRRKGNKSAEQKNDTPTTPDTPTPAPEAKTSTVEAAEKQTADNEAKESKPRRRRRGGRRRAKSTTPQSEE